MVLANSDDAQCLLRPLTGMFEDEVTTFSTASGFEWVPVIPVIGRKGTRQWEIGLWMITPGKAVREPP